MMNTKRLVYFFAALWTAMALSSCSETDDSQAEFEDWQARNEAYYKEIYTRAKANADGTWRVLHNWSYNDGVATAPTDHIAVKVLTAGTGSGSPLYSDSARVSCVGRLIPSTSYADGYAFVRTYAGKFNPNTVASINIGVHGTFGKATRNFTPYSVPDGLTTALMNMHIGDRWLVYVPYQLGYGVRTSNYVPAYSTLIFDISLSGYSRAGVKVEE